MDNPSIILYGKSDLRYVNREIPVPGLHDVIVEMKKCGICGTDIHMWQEGKCGPLSINPNNPLVIGHESSGIIHMVGAAVKSLKKGDRVALELGLPCRRCDLCKQGKYNLCKPFSYGALTKYHCYPADFCHKIPENVTMDEAALIEPLAVCVRACKRARVKLNSSVLICGSGCIGICVTMVAKANGATKICVTDISKERLELAKTFGATHTVLVDSRQPLEIANQIILELGGESDSSIECTGVESSLETAIHATQAGGTIAPVGLGVDNLTINYSMIVLKELDIRGVFSYCNDYPVAISLIANGKVKPASMITHRYPLKEAVEAFKLLQSKQTGVFKVMIDCDS